MSSILVNTTDFFSFAEELANEFNLTCEAGEELTAEDFFQEVSDINNEQIEDVRSYLDWFDCFAISESVHSWNGRKEHTTITSDIDTLFNAISKYNDVIISQDDHQSGRGEDRF